MYSVLSQSWLAGLCCTSLVTGDVGMSWLAVRALHSDLLLLTTECLQATLSFGSSSSWDGPVHPASTFTVTVSSHFIMDLKERATTKEIKCEPTQTTAAKLFPSKSPATAKVSLLVVSRSYLLQLYCFTSSVIVGHQADLAGWAYLVLTPAEKSLYQPSVFQEVKACNSLWYTNLHFCLCTD